MGHTFRPQNHTHVVEQRQQPASGNPTGSKCCRLRRKGADIDAEDLAGSSPAHLAAARRHLLLLSALLQVGGAAARHVSTERTVDLADDRNKNLESTEPKAIRCWTWQADPPPNIDRRNARGITVRSLAGSLMDRADIDDWWAGALCAAS